MIDLGDSFGEDGTSAEEEAWLAKTGVRLAHYAFMMLRLQRAIDGWPKDKKDGIWAKFRLVWAMRKENASYTNG